MKFGDFDLSIVRECKYLLDGGAMFGVVPKPLWNKTTQCDELNRVTLFCNLLLIETGTNRILVETGMGHRWTAQERDRYGIESFVSPDKMLHEIQIANDQIDAVIISHLHFDHVGGAVIDVDGKLVPAFPNAKYYVQKGEWEFAYKANARARASYRPQDYEPLRDYGVLELIDGDTEIVPGVFARVSGGHTKHHQVVTFESRGQKGVYFADIMPMRPHVSPAWVMGYDHYPLISCDVKHEWLTRAVQEKWLVVFDHEPGVPWGHVRLNGNKFEFEPLPEDTLRSRAVTSA